MSGGDHYGKKGVRSHSWAAFVGDFPLLKDFLAEKDSPIWSIIQLFDAFLRGFGQVVFANNPVSGFLIAVTLGITAPGTLVFCASSGLLGLLLSVLMKDSQDNVENGLTVYNPLLVGAVSYALLSDAYGALDSFSLLLLLLATIFSVYLARSLGTAKFPCTTWPFNLAEFGLLFALASQNDSAGEMSTGMTEALARMDNATSDATGDVADLVLRNATTTVNVDWGMVFRGFLVSPSQVYAVENVAAGSTIYLAILIYSPITAGFSFLGALMGTLAGIQLGAPLDEIFSGFWGFNCLLTGASLGGNFFVVNGHTVIATIIAIIYTSIVQYAALNLLTRIGLPILTIPFVTVTSLFLKLRDADDAVFPRPALVSFPEKQRADHHAARGKALEQDEDSGGEREMTREERQTTIVIED